jgi:hypothetical protein
MNLIKEVVTLLRVKVYGPNFYYHYYYHCHYKNTRILLKYNSSKATTTTILLLLLLLLLLIILIILLLTEITSVKSKGYVGLISNSAVRRVTRMATAAVEAPFEASF